MSHEALNPQQFGIPEDPDPPKGMWGRGPKHSDSWSRATTRKVPIDSLVATQPMLHPEVLDKYRHGGKSRTLPKVAEEGGVNYLIDGHHRVVIAKEQGETHIRARHLREGRQ